MRKILRKIAVLSLTWNAASGVLKPSASHYELTQSKQERRDRYNEEGLHAD
jgi:hypothetical protein